MAAPVLHADQVGLDMIVGENLNLAYQTGLLTNTNVNSASTYTDLKNSIETNSLTLPSEFRGYVGRLNRAIDYGKDDGSLSDANVAAATTVAELVAFTQAGADKIGPIAIE